MHFYTKKNNRDAVTNSSQSHYLGHTTIIY